MKVSAKQLDVALGRLMTLCRGYSNDTDVDIEISITQEDPGNGILTDCITLKGHKLHHKNDEEEGLVSTATVEIYPADSGVEPRACKTDTFKVKKKY